MATITNATLTISHDHEKQLVTPVVKCKIQFTALELCQMRACPKENFFKLKCQLWGDGNLLTLWADELRWTYSNVHYFPDASITATEERMFTVTLGAGVLDEDLGQDTIYGKVILYNLLSGVPVTKKTNVVIHSF